MKLYGGIDLHSNNSYVVLLNESNKTVYEKRLKNDLEVILQELEPYKGQVESLVVESTYNWYWQVDGLQKAGYKVRLANPSATQQYSGLKHTGDKTDATWLATMNRLEILPEGYIYPQEQRGVRELLRRRIILVKQQTQCLLSIQGLVSRYENNRLSSKKIKSFIEDENLLLQYVSDKSVSLAELSQLRVLKCIAEEIKKLEIEILLNIKEEKNFKLLKTLPGVGPILAMVILLETGEIKRFSKANNYSSYCRCVESKRISNERKKGENNRKNGNVYLGWAFIEASNAAIRYYPEVNRYYQRKLKNKKRVVALKTVANKLSRACYYVLRDGAQFEMKKLFI